MKAKTKAELIAEYLAKPLIKGDGIYVKGMSFNRPDSEELVEVLKVEGDTVFFERHGYRELQTRKLTEVRKSVREIGANPFQPELRASAYAIDIEQLFWRGGVEARDRGKRFESVNGKTIPEVCQDPTVIDSEGNEVEYQRGLVWTLEQKQMLIESIYNHVEIGKFVFRRRSWDWVESRIKEGKFEHTAFADLVDGKQRFNALWEFYNDKFPDLHGNLYSDLSSEAQHIFLSYRQLFYVELDEDTTDKDALRVFLAINFTGVPMSKEHIDYVRSIRM